MNQQEVTPSINQELKREPKKTHLSPVVTAFFIGFLIGIIVYSIAVNSWGFFTLIPLVMIYALLKKSKKNHSA